VERKLCWGFFYFEEEKHMRKTMKLGGSRPKAGSGKNKMKGDLSANKGGVGKKGGPGGKC
jgi:hypothetical protein